MTTQTIEVEGLPEGWRAVAYRVPKTGEWFLGDYSKEVHKAVVCVQKAFILEKIQPSRINVLTENDIEAVALNDAGCAVLDRFYEITGHETTHEMRRLVKPLLRVGIVKYVNQTDIPLNSGEPKLSLSVCECKGLFEGNQPAVNKVKEFIRENS